jgi:hypothetical protein
MRKYSIIASYEPPDPDEAEVEVRITFTFRPGDPGRYSGPPEHCYPAEPAEVEFDSVEQETAGQWIAAPELEEWAAGHLRTKGYDRAVEEAEEENQPDPDDARDRDRDDKLMGVGRYAPMDDGGC